MSVPSSHSGSPGNCLVGGETLPPNDLRGAARQSRFDSLTFGTSVVCVYNLLGTSTTSLTSFWIDANDLSVQSDEHSDVHYLFYSN